jgi:two-component system NtrC family sensor kinase
MVENAVHSRPMSRTVVFGAEDMEQARSRDAAVPSALGRAAVDAVLRLVPWPAIALDEQGEVLRCSDELAPADAAVPSPVPAQGLRSRWPHYRQALGDGSVLVPQTVEITLPAGAGQVLHERLVLRRTDWGACLFVMDQTELHSLQTSNLQTARLAALGFMIAGVSHELSNPLTSVHSIVQLLRSQSQPSEEVLRKGLDSIGGNVQRILEISRRLLSFSRLGDEPRSAFAIGLAIDEALASARADGLFERIKLTVRHDPHAEVHANIGQLREVFSNLLLNAAQAMGGSGQIDVRTQRTRDGQVDVALTDGGPGIPAEIAPRIFEAFFTTKPSGGGTGLGLAISQQILAEHGGRLWFENNPDGGASFHVQLPQVSR